MVSQQFGEPRRKPTIVRAEQLENRTASAQPVDRSHCDDCRRELLRDLPKHTAGIRAAAVDLVHEDEGGNAQPLQRPHQHSRLRLHALHGGEHQHGAVEHAQHPFHFGDEIRVAGRVDQVDRDVADNERDDRGFDRDAALPFKGEGIGLGTAFIDAPDRVDHAGGVEQPLGQACLTGVYMRQNPEVQRSH